MSRFRLIFELTVIVTIGILLVVFLVWCFISIRRDFKLRGHHISAEELNRERVTVLIPRSIRDLQ
jgi:hypothetical protein